MPTAAPRPLDVVDLRSRLDGGADLLLIDVRTPAEFGTAHIEGSYNVPLDTLAEHRGELARHLDRTTVLICQSGGRAAQAEQRLAEAGLTNTHVLDGGLGAWMTAGFAVRRGEQRWSLERQVRLVAGAIVLLSILVSIAWPPARFLAGAIGAGLTFAALTDTCAMGVLLSKLPYNRAGSCDMDTVVERLVAGKAA
jgi:rhodanese-related sulfurtransferase